MSMDFKSKSSTTEILEYDVIIIGAGLSGLSTAFYLAQRDPNLNVLILEKHSSVGGFGLTTNLGDLGFKYVTTKHLEVWDLTELLGIEFIQKRCTTNWKEFSDWTGIQGLLSEFETVRFIQEMDVKCKEYNPKRSIQKSSVTMENMITRKLFFEQSRNFIRFVIRAVFGIESAHILVHEFLTTCFTCLSFTDMIDSLLQAEYIPQGGWKHVVQRLLMELPESYEIQTQSCVIQLLRLNQSHAIVETHVQQIYQAKMVVLACPWENIMKITFDPPLSQTTVNRVMQFNSFVISFILKYSVSAWNRIGQSGFIFDYTNRFYCREINPCILSGALYFNSIQEIPTDLLQPILQLLGNNFGDDVLIPLDSKVKLYEQAVLIDFPTREPRDTLVWASTNHSTRFRGFINGAVYSGVQAAVAVLQNIRPSTVSYVDYFDTHDAHFEPIGYWKHMMLAFNLTTAVSLVKSLGAVYFTYQIYKRVSKYCVNAW